MVFVVIHRPTPRSAHHCSWQIAVLTVETADTKRDLCRKASGRDREGQKASKVRLLTPAPSSFLLIPYVFRDYGSKVVGEVTLDQVYGGARGIKSLVWEVGVS